MYNPVLNGEPISVSIASFVVQCRLFQMKSERLNKPDRGESGAWSDSVREFVGALGGGVAETRDANLRDLLIRRSRTVFRCA
jgi:hypothetical protein